MKSEKSKVLLVKLFESHPGNRHRENINTILAGLTLICKSAQPITLWPSYDGILSNVSKGFRKADGLFIKEWILSPLGSGALGWNNLSPR